MLNVYGHFFSMPSNKVRLCVSYLGLPHEYHHIDLPTQQHQSQEYLAINPAGRVPSIEDDRFTLSQSDAINKYLCAVSGPSHFYPEEAQEQAKINQWADFCTQHIQHAMGRLFFNRIAAPLLGEKVDEGSVSTGEKMLARDLPLIEEQLKGHEFLVGDKITLADINLAAALEPAEMAKVNLKSYPSIQKWRQAVQNREFYKRVHKQFGAEMNAR